MSSDVARYMPLTATAPLPNTPTAQALANSYLASPNNVDYDTMMPLHLAEELSPRFSRAKRTRGYNLRRAAREAEVERAVRDKVDAWERGGRDAGLMASQGVQAALGMGMGLGSVGASLSVRGRTREEVRKAARAVERARDERVGREVKKAVERGMVQVQVQAQVSAAGDGLGVGAGGREVEWVQGAKAAETARKQRRRRDREDKVERRMATLKLDQAGRVGKERE